MHVQRKDYGQGLDDGVGRMLCGNQPVRRVRPGVASMAWRTTRCFSAVKFDFHTGRPERHLRLGECFGGRVRIWDCGVRGLVHALRGRLRRAAHLFL